jgi:hypothetical protein
MAYPRAREAFDFRVYFSASFCFLVAIDLSSACGGWGWVKLEKIITILMMKYCPIPLLVTLFLMIYRSRWGGK